MCRPTRLQFRGRLIWLGEMSENDAQPLYRGTGGSTHRRKARATREAPKRGQVRDDRTNRTPVRDRPGALGWQNGGEPAIARSAIPRPRIGSWGGPRRVYAAFKFFLYTLTGSLLMLLAIMAMYWTAGTTDITVLLTTHFPPDMQKWLWLAFFASFAVKIPMWPVHTWLPDAHVEAPTAG